MAWLQRGSLYCGGLALFASGAAWLVLHYWQGSDGPLATQAVQAWSLRLHGAAAMALLVIVGTLLPTHVRCAWRRRQNRTSGLAMLGAAAVLAATGWGLYYAGDDAQRGALSLAHWLLGLAALPMLVIHRRLGRAAGSLQSCDD